MNQDAIKEIAKQLGVGANYLAEHLTEFAPQWGMFKAIQDLAGVLLMGFILAVLAFVMRKATRRLATTRCSSLACSQFAAWSRSSYSDASP